MHIQSLYYNILFYLIPGSCTLIFFIVFFLIILRPPRSTRTDTLFPYTTLFRSHDAARTRIVGNVEVGLLLNHDYIRLAGKSPSPNWAQASSLNRSEEHTSELQSLMRISYAVFCLKKKIKRIKHSTQNKINQQSSPKQSS